MCNNFFSFSGTTQGSTIANEKKAKVGENLRNLNLLFNRLRLIYEKCNESCQSGMEYTHIESLIPLKEEWDMKSDEKKSSEAYRLVYEESKEVMEVCEIYFSKKLFFYLPMLN